MARRKLLGDEQWAALFALPAGERDVVRHCSKRCVSTTAVPDG